MYRYGVGHPLPLLQGVCYRQVEVPISIEITGYKIVESNIDRSCNRRLERRLRAGMQYSNKPNVDVKYPVFGRSPDRCAL